MAKNKKNKVNQENNTAKKHWFRDFKAELKRVTWPSRKSLLENTVVVVSMVVIVAAIIFVLDLAFNSLHQLEAKQIMNLKNTITASEEAEEGTTNESSENTATETTETSENEVNGVSIDVTTSNETQE